jgi:regulatory protein
MKISKISRNKIFLTNGEIIDINLDIKIKYDLKEDMSIDSLYDEISYEASLSKALYYLSLRDRTEEELRIKLREKFKNKSSVDRAVKKMSEMGYINDFDYALSYIKNSRFGTKRTEFELMKRGVSKKIINEALALGEGVSDYDKLKKALKKVLHKNDKQIIQYLIRQGFELEDILYVLRHAKEER